MASEKIHVTPREIHVNNDKIYEHQIDKSIHYTETKKLIFNIKHDLIYDTININQEQLDYACSIYDDNTDASAKCVAIVDDGKVYDAEKVKNKVIELKKLGFKIKGYFHKQLGLYTILGVTDNERIFSNYCKTLGLKKKVSGVGNREARYIVYIVSDSQYMHYYSLNGELGIDYKYPHKSEDIVLILKGVTLSNVEGVLTETVLDASIVLLDCDLSSVQEFTLDPYKTIISRNCKTYESGALNIRLDSFLTGTAEKDNREIENIDNDILDLDRLYEIDESLHYGKYTIFTEGVYDEFNCIKSVNYLEGKDAMRSLLNECVDVRIRTFRNIEAIIYGEEYTMQLDGINIEDRLVLQIDDEEE